MNEANRVYVMTDSESRIIAVNSGEFIKDLTDWIEIDSGYGDKYYHAQGNYFPLPIYTNEGILRYKMVDGVPVERTAAEITADIAALPQPETTVPVTWSALAAAYKEGVDEA